MLQTIKMAKSPSLPTKRSSPMQQPAASPPCRCVSRLKGPLKSKPSQPLRSKFAPFLMLCWKSQKGCPGRLRRLSLRPMCHHPYACKFSPIEGCSGRLPRVEIHPALRRNPAGEFSTACGSTMPSRAAPGRHGPFMSSGVA
jgi:hypothetical protein